MSQQKYGMVTWNDAQNQENKRQFSNEERVKFEFANLKEGNNIYRVVTDLYAFSVHKFKATESEKGYGKRVYCSKPLHGSCPCCEAGSKAKQRHLVGVIDRADQKLRILDLGSQVYQQLVEYKDDIEWGVPTMYDINIRKNSKAGASGFYTVMPRSKAPVSQADQELLTASLKDLERDMSLRVTPPKPESVEKRMESLGWVKGTPAAKVSNGDSAMPQTELTESDDEDYSFPRPSAQA